MIRPRTSRNEEVAAAHILSEVLRRIQASLSSGEVGGAEAEFADAHDVTARGASSSARCVSCRTDKGDHFALKCDVGRTLAASNSVMAEDATGTETRVNLNGPSLEDDPFLSSKAAKRRRIKGVMEPSKLSAPAATAQKEEMERLRRLQESKSEAGDASLMRPDDVTPSTAVVGSSHAASIGTDVGAVENDLQIAAPLEEPTLGDEVVSGTAGIIVLSSDEEDDATDAATARVIGADSVVFEDGLDEEDFRSFLVNPGHPKEDPDMFAAPHLVPILKAHQMSGIKFMYQNVIESLDRFRDSPGFGCILAHSMGLGKTLQVVTLIDVMYRYTPVRRVLIIVPVNTLQNWRHEIDRWLPLVPPFDSDGAIKARPFEVYLLNELLKGNRARAEVVSKWFTKGGVLLVGYELYRILATTKAHILQGEPAKKKGRRVRSKAPHNVDLFADGKQMEVVDIEEEEMLADLLVDVRKALVDPGPDIVICDEGHRIKTMKGQTANVLRSINTRRRIVLTGYPLQNNLMEYWCMVDFVRPNYLGSKHEYCNMFERPIKNGQCVDSTSKDIQIMRQRSHVLSSLLRGFVQRRSHALLHGILPPKKEFVLMIRKTAIQQRLYRRFMYYCENEMDMAENCSINPLRAFAVCCKIWNHPDILHRILRGRSSGGADIDMELACGSAGKRGGAKQLTLDELFGTTSNVGAVPSGRAPQIVPPGSFRPNWPSQEQQYRLPSASDVCSARDRAPQVHPAATSSITYWWAEEYMKDYTPGDVLQGGKFAVGLSLLDEGIENGDKMLIFSQSLFTLDLLEEYLKVRQAPGTGFGSTWKRNRNYLRLDGSTNGLERERLISRFNHEGALSLFLISTRAGGLGINLTAANRVIVFDASWNPCHDAQAMCRVYRYGQTKPVFIYRFVTDNSMERSIYTRQVGKQGIADRVVDEKLVDAAVTRQELSELMSYDEGLDAGGSMWSSFDEASCEDDDVLLRVCKQHQRFLTREPFKHETLLVDHSDQPLSEEEKKEAERQYQRDLQAMRGFGGFVSGRGRPPILDNYVPPYSIDVSSAAGGIHPRSSVAVVRPLQATPLPMQLRVAEESANIAGYAAAAASFSNRGLRSGGGATPFSISHIKNKLRMQLPSITFPGLMVTIHEGQAVSLVRTHRGTYIRTADGQVLDARGSVYDTSMTHAGQVPTHPTPMLGPAGGGQAAFLDASVADYSPINPELVMGLVQQRSGSSGSGPRYVQVAQPGQGGPFTSYMGDGGVAAGGPLSIGGSGPADLIGPYRHPVSRAISGHSASFPLPLGALDGSAASGSSEDQPSEIIELD